MKMLAKADSYVEVTNSPEPCVTFKSLPWARLGLCFRNFCLPVCMGNFALALVDGLYRKTGSARQPSHQAAGVKVGHGRAVRVRACGCALWDLC